MRSLSPAATRLRRLGRGASRLSVARRSIDSFVLARDVSDQFFIPERLYGRELEIRDCLAAFDRVMTDRRPELMLVSGPAGAGRSSLVNELQKALVPRRGLFASGKFDQYKRDLWARLRVHNNQLGRCTVPINGRDIDSSNAASPGCSLLLPGCNDLPLIRIDYLKLVGNSHKNKECRSCLVQQEL
jgi:hypothetical protein